MFLKLSHDFVWNYFWNLKCKESITDSKQEQEPIIPILLIRNGVFSSALWTVTIYELVSSSDRVLDLLDCQSQILLLFMNDWSILGSISEHFINDMILDWDACVLNELF